ncbi:cation:proton antiporter [Paracoccus cavernae]|uniref:Cation:proton antiporter n=1 Tax=Paracoccus cavernae TaxID=1571207 RepID=A0ABT8D5F1_9RHOB|nr:cation:proton antiporter [Paracoccus cavernae]
MADPSQAADAAHAAFDLVPVVVLLAAGVFAVPLFRRIGLGSVLGYLAAGLLVGPFGLAFFHDAQSIIHVAELGVVLFLFVIGLEMQPSRLWVMRGEIFGLGLVQVCLAIAVLVWVGIVQGFPIEASFIAGTGFVLTSTAIVMQVLAERGELNQPHGRKMVAVLLFEDLAIVPLLALVAFLAPGGVEATMADRIWSIVIGLGAIAALVIAGRYLLDPMFRMLALWRARGDDGGGAFGGTRLGGADAGGRLVDGDGAFLAGVLLSESTFRHQLEADVEPFRGLLLGLFFLGVGMALDLNIILQNWTTIVISVPAYMILKMAVIYSVARLFKAGHREALDRMVLMAQGGEFAFVLYASATSFGILTPEWNANLTAIIILSMVLTPLVLIVKERIQKPVEASTEGLDGVEDSEGAVLMIGFGRMGQVISQALLARGYHLSIIETNPDQIRDAEEFGFRVFYGDGSRADILHAAGAAKAKLVIATADDADATARTVEVMKHEYPLVPVLARAQDRGHAIKLMQLGADYQMRETYESAQAIAAEALSRLGESAEVVGEVMAAVRQRDADRLDVESVGGLGAGKDYLYRNAAKPAGH